VSHILTSLATRSANATRWLSPAKPDF
jgi:hypothetical protein